MQITEQVIVTILTVICGPSLLAVIGILAVRNKNRAIADRERVEAENAKIKASAEMVMAEAQKIKNEAEAKLAKEKSEASQMQLITQMLQQQVEINRQSYEDREKYWGELEKKEKRDESNYRVLANALRDVGQMMITEVQTQGKRLNADIRVMQEETRSLVHREMVEAVASSQQQYSQRDILKFVASGKAIPFPREHGYTFRKCRVKVKSEKGINMFSAPMYFDQKPIGRLFDSDEVWIMEEVPFPVGWAAVRAMNLGVNGWVDKNFIEIENCEHDAVLNPT